MDSHTARLMDYFKGHTRRVLASMDVDSKLAEAKRILGFLARNRGLNPFTRTQLYRVARGSFHQPEELDDGLALLVEAASIWGGGDTRAGARQTGADATPRVPPQPAF